MQENMIFMKKLFLLSLLAFPTYIFSMMTLMSHAAFVRKYSSQSSDISKLYQQYDELVLKDSMDRRFAVLIAENSDVIEADLSPQELDEWLDALWGEELIKFSKDMEEFERDNKPPFLHMGFVPRTWSEMKDMTYEAKLLLRDAKRRYQKKCNSLPLLKEKVLFARMIHAHKKK